MVHHVLRSSQLDAGQLDGELVRVLTQKLVEVGALFPATAMERLKPELELAVDALLGYFALVKQRQTPGAQMHNLVLASVTGTLGTTQRILAFLASVLLPYAWKRARQKMRLQNWNEESGWKQKCYLLATHLESVWRISNAVNFLVFLRQGTYPSLLFRILGIQMRYKNPNQNREILFDLMNQQLVWNTLSSFLLFFLPLVNTPSVRRGLRHLLPAPTQVPGCPVCHADVDSMWVPCKADCGDVFCYYCIASAKEAGPYTCPTCRVPIASFERI